MSARLMDRLLLAAGVMAPIAFVTVFTVLGAVRPGYDAVRQYVSLLALGDGGWIQQVNFIVFGLAGGAAGLVFAQRWSRARSGRTAGRLITLAGLALAWCGVFTGDPAQGYPAGAPAGLPTDMSWHAGLHYLGATIVFVGLPAAMILAVRGESDRRWAWYGRASAVIMFGSWLATFLIPGTHGVADAAGLLQRLGIVAGLGWVAVASARELGRAPAVQAPAVSRA